MATTKTTATQLSAKTLCTSSGKMAKMSPIWVNPMPTASDSAAMVMLRGEKPAVAII